MDLTKSKGNITELNCIIKFMEMGFDCSIPYGDSSKYDFIADINGKLIKVQCKSCSNPISKNKESLGEKDLEAIQFKCCAQTTNTKKTIRHTYSKEDIDYFATYYEGNVYLIPVEECSSSKILRFSPPMNNIQNYNKAENYLIEKVLGEFQNKNFLLQKEEENKNIKKQKHYCSKCGENLVLKENSVCHSCVSKERRKVINRPSREELKSMIRSKPFTTLAKEFGVSDNAIRKWCKSENLPYKKTEIKNYSDEEWRLI